MSDTDQILLNRWISDRDAQAFKRLTTKHCGMVYATCLRILRNAADAEEAAQESFAALATVSRGPDGAMGAWLHRIATNQALNRRRADGRRRERELRYAQTRARTTEIEWDDISQFVDQCIESLPEPLRSNIVAHFIEDETLTAIAAREGVTHSAVSQRIRKGVELIRDRMRRNGIPIAAAALGAMFSHNLAQASTVPSSLTAALGKRALTGSTARVSKAVARSAYAKAVVAAGATIGVALGLLAAYYVAAPQTVTAERQREPLVFASVPATPAPDPIPEPAVEQPAEPAPKAATSPAVVDEVQETPPSSWREVVDAYAAHQNRIRRIQFDYEDVSEGEYLWSSVSSEPGYKKTFQRGSLLTDGERCRFEQYSWGDQYFGDRVPRDRPHITYAVDDGYTYIQLNGSGQMGRPERGYIQIHPDARNSAVRDSAYRDGRTHVLFSRYPGRLMIGLPLAQGLRLEEILYAARSIALRDEREVVRDAACCVIDADTAYGDFSVWFDPKRDYSVVRCIVDIGYGDVNESLPMDTPECWERYEYTAVRIVQIDGQWVPKESESRQTVQRLQGNGFDFTSRHKRSNIRLLGPGEDDNAYVMRGEDIPNGTRLMDPVGTRRGVGDPTWRWYNGQFVLTYDDPDGTVRRDDSTARGFGGGIIARSVQ